MGSYRTSGGTFCRLDSLGEIHPVMVDDGDVRSRREAVIPAGLPVPRAQQRPMRIQPPLLGRVRVRADWLTIAIMAPRGDALSTPTGSHDPRLAADGASGPPTPTLGGQPAPTEAG